MVMRSRSRFNGGWKFMVGDPAGAEQPFFDDSAWRDVDLPHDWSIEGPLDQNAPSGQQGGFMPTGVGWYRKTFAPPTFTDRQRVLIDFEGIYRYSSVWINGQLLGLRPSGFTGFQYDLTPYVVPGQANFIAVRVDNSNQPNLRWYSGSGIYRHVWLSVADRIRVDWNGTYIATPVVSAGTATVRVVTTLANFHTDAADTRLETQIFDAMGRVVADSEVGQSIQAGSRLDVTQEFKVPSPALWSLENTNLYTAYSLVRQDGRRVDDYLSTFGIREIRFDKDQGVFLNGNHVKLKGVSMHHDLGCLGAAVHERAIERRLKAVQALGCNALRTSHNPPAPQVLDLCDRLGLLVIDEAFDKWFGSTDEPPVVDLPTLADWWQRDLNAFLLRDRNHPCVMIWSVGNEAGIAGSSDHETRLQQLVDFVHNAEPTRPVTAALAPPGGTADEVVAAVTVTAGHVDVVAINYQEAYFDDYHAAFPNVPMLCSESFPYVNLTKSGSFEPINPWWSGITRDFVAGQFVWNGVDHLGESAGWPSKGWPNGLFDSCAFPKPATTFFQTVWRNTPNVRIYVSSDALDIDPGYSPWQWPKSVMHWSFAGSEGTVLRVNTVSNCDSVELIVNGQTYGQQTPVDFPNWTIPWYVRYAPGKVEAIGRIGGNVVSSDVIQTAGTPVRIKLQAVPDRIAADGMDITFIEASILDARDVLVPVHDTRLLFFVEGPAKLIGVDNGDLRSRESFQGSARTTFGGRALAVIQSTGAAGPIVVVAMGDGLTTAAAGVAALI
jgi:beta-galactosidase